MDATVPTPTRAQTKRTADSPLQDRPGKIPHVAAIDHIIEVSVSYATSGKNIAKLKISKESSVAKLMKSVQKHLQSGVVQALLNGETTLQAHACLGAIGVENGAEIKAVIVAHPTLFLANPEYDQNFLSDDEHDCESDDEDFWSGGNDTGAPQDMSQAPEVALQVANAMMAAAPDLRVPTTRISRFARPEDIPIEVDYGVCEAFGEVIIIASPGDDAKIACLRALKTPKMPTDEEYVGDEPKQKEEPGMPLLWRRATIEEANWTENFKGERGFNGTNCSDRSRNSHEAQILAVTKIMSETLDKHFCFGFPYIVFIDGGLELQPRVWGGYASDGNIVGVKSVEYHGQ
eukprot:gnl/TRDRNA2_/TRDRNA2_176091_c1_seq1.p1 gnl/TRDRNA2_/TRDRNA2_176091_c1~~gnl/TRDRNA2_/TRDRNA2_176091_c1_seq1.p1  ORF type:complete len:346 (+),score=44.06 gnl/TRDRNA2_/TRDRNA2_176091_c1_seq1:117-1154(+)